MKPLLLATTLALTSTGCSLLTVTSPTPLKDGDQFICKTQPRVYYLVDGTRQVVVDYYAQATPCPKEPIQ